MLTAEALGNQPSVNQLMAQRWQLALMIGAQEITLSIPGSFGIIKVSLIDISSLA